MSYADRIRRLERDKGPEPIPPCPSCGRNLEQVPIVNAAAGEPEPGCEACRDFKRPDGRPSVVRIVASPPRAEWLRGE
jgi:hypothetical protein